MIDPLVGTRNFAVAEWERKSSGGRTPDSYRYNAQRTLELLQRFRAALAVPIIITDAWRSADENAHTPGSARNSQHLTGAGVDFVVPSLSKRDVAGILDYAVASGELGDFRQLIYYLTDEHYHLGTGTGQQLLVKVDATTYVPYTGADALPAVPIVVAQPADAIAASWITVALAALAIGVGVYALRES